MKHIHSSRWLPRLPIAISAAIAITIAVAQPLRADWTAKIPGPPSNQLDVTPASRFGAVATWIESDFLTGRLAWFSPTGELLLDYRFSSSEFQADGEQMFPLNRRQVLIHGNSKYRLLTVTGKGTYATRDYAFSSNQRVNIWLKDLIEADLTGFYYVDSATWTMNRVDFPAPPPSADDGATLFLQSASTPTGPWNVFQETKVPTNRIQEYFRLQLTK